MSEEIILATIQYYHYHCFMPNFSFSEGCSATALRFADLVVIPSFFHSIASSSSTAREGDDDLGNEDFSSFEPSLPTGLLLLFG